MTFIDWTDENGAEHSSIRLGRCRCEGVQYHIVKHQGAPRIIGPDEFVGKRQFPAPLPEPSV